jgi:hypothetical protein
MSAITGGRRGMQRSDELLTRAAEIAKTLHRPQVDSNINSARTVCAFLEARMSDVVEYSEAFERSCRAASRGGDEGEYYHRFSVLSARITALFVLGRHRQATEELQYLLNEARATENISALLTLSALRTRAEVAAGRPQDGVARLELEHAQLPRHQFGLLHIYHMISVLRVGCATGDHAWALRWAQPNWERFQQSIFKRRGMLAVIAPTLHARLLINHGVRSRQSVVELTKCVSQDMQVLEHFSAPGARAAYQRTRARLAYLAGDRASALRALQESIALFETQSGVADEAARDRYAYGACLGNEAGTALQASALDALRQLGVVNPLRDLASYYPELFLPSQT